jgi:hypothetical protein
MPFYSLGRNLKYSMANGALVSVTALVPKGHDVVIIDENVEPIDFNALRFDVVGVRLGPSRHITFLLRSSSIHWVLSRKRMSTGIEYAIFGVRRNFESGLPTKLGVICLKGQIFPEGDIEQWLWQARFCRLRL